MVEWVMIIQYRQSLTDDLQHWLNHGDPTTADQLVELVESGEGPALAYQALETHTKGKKANCNT